MRVRDECENKWYKYTLSLAEIMSLTYHSADRREREEFVSH